ncbi:MAG: peptidyl-prolyl cis-trans isomerase [Armatimonadia bacterium]
MRILRTAVLVAAIAAAALAYGQAAGGAAATVNGQKISQDQFLSVLKARYGGQAMKALIMDAAIRQAGAAAGVSVSKEDLERKAAAARQRIDATAATTGETYETWLLKRGLTYESHLVDLYDWMLLEKMVEKQVKVTNEDVADFYQKHKEDLREPAQVQVAHILVKDENTAKAVREELRSGKITWEDAVKQYSLHAATKDRAGDLGFIPEGDSPVQKAAMALKTNGELSAPVMSGAGWHILKRLAYKETRIPPYAEIEAALRDNLEMRQLTALAAEKRNQILKDAKVEILIKVEPEATPLGAATARQAEDK